MAMFGRFNPLGLFDGPGEGHAFLIGFFEAACPWPAARPPSPKSQDEINGEDHYYTGGRFIGFVTLLLILLALAKLAKEVLL